MAIPIEREPEEIRHQMGGIIEVCHFCRNKTLHWHENTNNPVCPKCAKLHKVSELPDHGQRIRARKRKERRTK